MFMARSVAERRHRRNRLNVDLDRCDSSTGSPSGSVDSLLETETTTLRLNMSAPHNFVQSPIEGVPLAECSD